MVSTPPMAAGWWSGRGRGNGLLEARGKFGVGLGLGQAVGGTLSPVQGFVLAAATVRSERS
ncbi:hypothetical protein AL532_18790 [Pseudomonas monteilii]|nr:hypothetical protein AL532_18790 [Pseudomonas monteilii]